MNHHLALSAKLSAGKSGNTNHCPTQHSPVPVMFHQGVFAVTTPQTGVPLSAVNVPLGSCELKSLEKGMKR